MASLRFLPPCWPPRALPLLGLALAAAAPLLANLGARADWSSTSSTQVILRVDPATGSANASGASYAIQGSGLGPIPALNSGIAPAAGLVLAPISDGAPFQVNTAYKPADALTTVETNGSLPAYSSVSVQQAGSGEGLAGEVASPIRGSARAGGPGSSATLTQSNTFTVFQ
jgi:hypothetical protein